MRFQLRDNNNNYHFIINKKEKKNKLKKEYLLNIQRPTSLRVKHGGG